MNKQFTIKIMSLEITLQFRTSQKTRKTDFAPIVINETEKQAVLDSLNLSEIKARARAMRAEMEAS